MWQIVERIQFKEKGVNALSVKVKLLNNTQSPHFIRPVSYTHLDVYKRQALYDGQHLGKR